MIDEHQPVGASTPWTPPAPPGAATRRRRSRWAWVWTALLIFVLVVVFAGFAIHVPYDTISPGSALSVDPRIAVNGAPTYAPKGNVMLLFVRERSHVNLWRYLQAKLDSNVEVIKNSDLNGPLSPAEVEAEAIADMAKSQISAKKLGLEAAGYKVPQLPGAVVLSTIGGYPADGVLRQNDVITAVDGHTVPAGGDVSSLLKSHKPGDTITFTVQRGSTPRTFRIKARAGKKGAPIVGVFLAPQYRFPVKVTIDTSDIGGPSAGLAMTLAVIDRMTPGNLTGGERIAVTGTIDDAGHVGEIGGIEQKTISARAAHAQLFIVPKCDTVNDAPKDLAACQKDLRGAKKRAGKIPVVPVGTLAEALNVLRQHGGDPVTTGAKAA